MADIHLERAHNFEFATARAQAKKWLEEANQELGLDISYQEGGVEDTATIKKAGVDAKATLTADKVVFEADLAFLAKPLKGVITQGIDEGLQKYFG